MTPCYCGALGGLSVLVGSLTYPSPGRMLGPPWLGHWTWRSSILLLGNGSGFTAHRCVCVVFVSLFPVMLLPVSCYSTSHRPWECLESWYVSVQVMYLLDMLFLNWNEYQYAYLNTYILPSACPTFYVLYGMTKKGCVKGVSNGSVGS